MKMGECSVDKGVLSKFLLQLNKLEGKDYLLATLAYKTAPTRSGIKPSSLIAFSTKNKNLYKLWEQYKQDVIENLGLDFFELKKSDSWILVLFYDQVLLEQVTNSVTNRRFLERMGYHHVNTLAQRLEILKQRFRDMCPHEIGVFLGIPIQDINGFIKHKGNNFLICKYWKVYHNPKEANHLFKRYDQAKMNAIYQILEMAS